MPRLILPAYQPGLGGGSQDDRILGTGLSLPGIEGVYQFNELLMNVRHWYDTFLFNQIDGLDDAELRTTSTPNPGEHGETPGNAYYGGRTINLSGQIRYYQLDKLRDMRQGLRNAFADIRQEKPLWIRHPSGDTNLDRIVYCRKQGKLELPDALGPNPSFSITLRASNPRILSYTLSSVTLAAGQSTVVFNDGNIFSQPRIRFFGAGSLARTASGVTQRMSVINVPASDYIEVDTSRRYKRVINSNGDNFYSHLTDSSDLIELEGGEDGNSLTFTGAGSVLIAWRHSWI